MNNGNGPAEDGWGGQTGDDHRPRESARSRSRSPVRVRDTGLCVHRYLNTVVFINRKYINRRGEVGANPGNNLHVSGLGHKIDNRDLEAAFGKFGRVLFYLWLFPLSR